jgi:uncharacterized protein
MLTLAMSLLLLIDGYNLIAPVAAPSRQINSDWLERERRLLVTRLVKHLPRRLRSRCTVVFDAANPPAGVDDRYECEGVSVRFSVGYPEADDLIEELIAAHSAPKQLAVVSSDHRIQAAARARGATALAAQPWLDDLLDNRIGLAPTKHRGAVQDREARGAGKPSDLVDKEQLSDWLREFGFDDEDA